MPAIAAASITKNVQLFVFRRGKMIAMIKVLLVLAGIAIVSVYVYFLFFSPEDPIREDEDNYQDAFHGR